MAVTQLQALKVSGIHREERTAPPSPPRTSSTQTHRKENTGVLNKNVVQVITAAVIQCKWFDGTGRSRLFWGQDLGEL